MIDFLNIVSNYYSQNQKSFSRAFRIGFETEEERKAFHSASEHWKHRISAGTGTSSA